MKKIFILILSALFIFLIVSCDNSLGTPPELVLSFTLGDWSNVVSGVEVDYTLKNDGEADLENCKINIGIDTSNDSTENYDEIGDYTYWTDGVDLNEGQSHTVNNDFINITGTAYNIRVLAAGFDSTDDSKSASKNTVIYYYNK